MEKTTLRDTQPMTNLQAVIAAPDGNDDDVGLEAGASGADGVDGDAPRAPDFGRDVTAGDALERGSGALHFAAADDGRGVRAVHRVDAS